MERLHGWVGTILRIDLTDGAIEKVPTRDYRPEEFIGGVGLNARIFWDLGCPRVGAFDPLNPIIISTGPLTGIYGPFGRGEVCSISPQCYPDELYTYSGFGGKFPSELKYAGYDGIVIQGKAKRPAYISIHDDKVEIKDAASLWGKDTFEAQQALLADEPEASVFTIGPAGENLSRTAVILNETDCAAGQGGFGAVMGSKNLKAIAVRGTGAIAIARPADVLALTKPITEENKRNGTASMFRAPLFAPPELSDSFTKMYFVKPYGCFGCPQQCKGVADVPGIGRAAAACANWLWYLYSPEPTDYWEANMVCQKLGINSFEIIVGIPYLLLQSFRRGILNGVDVRKDFGLPAPKWLGGMDTDREFRTVLFNKIANGESPYADGTARFAEHFGNKLDIGAKLLELFEEISTARGYIHYADNLSSDLHWATDTRDPFNSCHEYRRLPVPALIELHDKSTEHFGLPSYDSTQILDVSKTVYEGAERVTAWVQDNQCLKNSLPVCEYFSSTRSFLDPPDMDVRVFESKLFSAVTGVDIDTGVLARAGERIGNLIRAIMVRREDRTREDDTINEPYFKKTVFHALEGNMGPIDKAKFEALKDRYYEARGWDAKTGRPTRAKLEELDLKDVADELEKEGRLP